MTHGNVADISETGARFEAEEPPGKGATALLKWGKHEAVCTIIWHDDGACGVWFKQKLAPEIVAETAALDRVVELPIASVGNITQGRKRSLAFLKRATQAHEEAGEVAAPSPPEFLPAVREPAPGSVFEPFAAGPDMGEGQDRTQASLVEEPDATAHDWRARDDMFDRSTEVAQFEPAPVERVRELMVELPTFEAPGEPSAAEQATFGRAAGLPPPTIGHSPTLAEVLKRYRETGSWEH